MLATQSVQNLRHASKTADRCRPFKNCGAAALGPGFMATRILAGKFEAWAKICPSGHASDERSSPKHDVLGTHHLGRIFISR